VGLQAADVPFSVLSGIKSQRCSNEEQIHCWEASEISAVTQTLFIYPTSIFTISFSLRSRCPRRN
jgi:hypothetical protein